MYTVFSSEKLNHHEYFILASLRGETLDSEGLRKEYEKSVQRMGIPVNFSEEERGWTFHRKLESYLKELIQFGFIVREDGFYELTESGKRMAEKRQKKVNYRQKRLRSFLLGPENASIISVIADAGLACIKLAVGFLFNSMALIADGFDSSVDVFSSLAVFLGIRFKRELISTSIVISMMFGTSGYILYEAFIRLLSPEPLIVSPIAVAATIASGIFCYGLSIYQHYVGKRSGSISLLTQSVDSRNHTLQATGVLVGLIFAIFDIYLVDSVVALIVGVFILKSALELLLEALKLARGGDLDTERFERNYEQVFLKRQRSFFSSWVLVILRDVDSKKEIEKSLSEVLGTEKQPISTAAQPISGFEIEYQLDPLLELLEKEGLIDMRDKRILLTERGKRVSSRKVARAKFGIPF